jgi:HTH-like domain
VRQAWLSDLIRELHAASYGSYGANRVHTELVLGRGIRVGHNAIAMLMRHAEIAGRTGTPKPRGIPAPATADDLIDRVFSHGHPNQALADRHHQASHARGQNLARSTPPAAASPTGRAATAQTRS